MAQVLWDHVLAKKSDNFRAMQCNIYNLVCAEEWVVHCLADTHYLASTAFPSRNRSFSSIPATLLHRQRLCLWLLLLIDVFPFVIVVLPFNIVPATLDFKYSCDVLLCHLFCRILLLCYAKT